MSAVNTMDKLLLQVLMEWGREHKPGDKLWRKRCLRPNVPRRQPSASWAKHKRLPCWT